MEYEWERNLISYVSLGRNIRDIRRKRRIRQSEMASRLEISLTHYSNCERGIRKISLEMLLRVCVALDVPLEMLLTRKGRDRERGNGMDSGHMARAEGLLRERAKVYEADLRNPCQCG